MTRKQREQLKELARTTRKHADELMSVLHTLEYSATVESIKDVSQGLYITATKLENL